jgi:hypothetical protein
MSEESTSTVSRRTALRGAAAAAAIGATGALTSSASAAGRVAKSVVGPLKVRKRLKLVDKEDQQRFLHQSSKPPVFLQGKKYPASARSGPDDGSYFIFNDENQDEKGGITVDSNVAQLSFDYPTVDALHLNAVNDGPAGAAQLSMRQMPDPSIPIEDLTPEDAPQRVLLGTDTVGDGALLFLYDSKGRPRISLQVDGDDVPRIQILDGDGNVVAQLPPEAPSGGSAGEVSPLLAPPSGRSLAG